MKRLLLIILLGLSTFALLNFSSLLEDSRELWGEVKEAGKSLIVGFKPEPSATPTSTPTPSPTSTPTPIPTQEERVEKYYYMDYGESSYDRFKRTITITYEKERTLVEFAVRSNSKIYGTFPIGRPEGTTKKNMASTGYGDHSKDLPAYMKITWLSDGVFQLDYMVDPDQVGDEERNWQKTSYTKAFSGVFTDYSHRIDDYYEKGKKKTKDYLCEVTYYPDKTLIEANLTDYVVSGTLAVGQLEGESTFAYAYRRKDFKTRLGTLKITRIDEKSFNLEFVSDDGKWSFSKKYIK